jgi:ATP-dependent DNA helicase RecQ
MPPTPIYTIGYGARENEAFFAALKAHQIEFLIDVRSQPYSRHQPEFTKSALEDALQANGIRYVFMGDTLGGRPDDEACYIDGVIDYAKLAAQPFYRRGIERLHNASRQGHRVALLCAEIKPENCRRTRLIGQTLSAEGIEVLHIDENDEIISQDQALLRLSVKTSKVSPKNSPAEESSLRPLRSTTATAELESTLQQTFGYPEFRPLQRRIIENVLRKHDSLAVMPTGSGKSLCYQLPATLFPGLTVVVSPLISLMEDQVLELREWGIAAVYLNSTLTFAEYDATVERIRAGDVKLLYAAPETLLRPETMSLLENISVDALVIDEAHCISEWGHDFRPEYRQLAGLRERLPKAVTLAVTATATRRVRADIKTSLAISDANEFISSFNRENLILRVDDKIAGVAQVRAFLDTHKNQAGIIYCATRDGVDTLTAQLAAAGYPALPYHAGMQDADRRTHQHRFRYEDALIMVATIAFGMGINKSNVRFVVHYDLPKNIESYYQQIGRAGRDGLPAHCLLLYAYGDVGTIRYFINQEPPELRRGAEMRLQAMLDFVETQTCRRIPLLNYFGEKFPDEDCEACDHCLAQKQDDQADPDADSAQIDLTAPARLLLNCALQTEQIFGAAHLIDVLRGSRAKKILQFKHDQLEIYDKGNGYTKDQWRHMATQFVRQGLLQRTPPHGSLRVTEAGRAVLDGGEFFGALPGAIPGVAAAPKAAHDPGLFELLRALRAQLAAERNVPPYVIFNDRSLVEMATYFPQTPETLIQIYGVGQRKVEEYAPHFLPVIQAYCAENDLQPIPKPAPTPATRHSQPATHKRTDYIYKQYQSGESIAAIAADLGFTEGTILKHLKKAHAAGRPLRVEGLKASSQLATQDELRVIQAFNDLGPDFLRPIFDVLDGQIPYEQLHLWRLIYLATRAA